MNDQTREGRSARWRLFEPAAGCLLLLGLAIAIAFDARLVGAWRVGWFGALFALSVVVAAWLTRPAAA